MDKYEDIIKEANLFSNFKIVSIEEGIILLQQQNLQKKDSRTYFFTDLNGNILFSNTGFKYATPFSSSLSYVIMWDNMEYIIDIKSKLLILISNNKWQITNGFRNGNLAVFDEESKKWGSYLFDRDNLSFSQDIPFIWDALEFSRDKDFVYAGKNGKILTSTFYDVQTRWSEISDFKFSIRAIKMLKEMAYDLKHYQYIIDDYKGAINQNKIRYITEKISRLSEEEITNILKNPYNLSDYYFDEKTKDICRNSMVSGRESLKTYQRKICRVTNN